jgi:hypothetical protein
MSMSFGARDYGRLDELAEEFAHSTTRRSAWLDPQA